MRHPPRSIRKTSLRGWGKWLPFLIFPFFILFFETWLHGQTITNGYQTNELNVTLREYEERLDALKDEEAALKRMERIHLQAPELGLISPNPNQIITLYMDENELVEP